MGLSPKRAILGNYYYYYYVGLLKIRNMIRNIHHCTLYILHVYDTEHTCKSLSDFVNASCICH